MSGRLRLGVLADLHADADAAAYALSLLRDAGAQELACLGDIVSEHRFSAQACRLLREAGAHCVMGNHDAIGAAAPGPVGAEDERAWLAALPPALELRRAGRRVVLCHGSPTDPTRYLLPGTAELAAEGSIGDAVLLCGHTHMPMREQVGQTLVVNPGSCSETRAPRSRDVLTCLTLDLPDGETVLHGFRRVAGGFAPAAGPLDFAAFAW